MKNKLLNWETVALAGVVVEMMLLKRGPLKGRSAVFPGFWS